MGSQRIEKTFSYLGYIVNVVGSTILLIVIGHFIIGVAIDIKHFPQKLPSRGDKRESLPVYQDYPDNKKFWSEHMNAWGTDFEPYYHWRRKGITGKYINVSSDGVRKTISTTKVEVNAKKIFVFGGSTIWGTGSKDEHTIPSFLQSQLGKSYNIYNYGETGFVSTQELNYLLKQLALGNIPDTVIFYDGVNDGYAGVYSPAIPRDVQNLRVRYKELRKKESNNVLTNLYLASNYKKLINFLNKATIIDKWEANISSKIQSNSTSVINYYEAHVKQVKALGKEYGFKAFFFWQPNIFNGERNYYPYEEAIIKNSKPVFIESQRQLYTEAKSRFSARENENIFFLGDIFNQVNAPIYIDWCHISPSGNSVIANRILEKIETKL